MYLIQFRAGWSFKISIMMKILIITIALLSFIGVSAKLEEVFKWKTIDWQWPNEQARSDAIKNGNFVPGSGMPNALLPWKDKLFVTVPSWKAGIPATLNYIPLNTSDPSPALIPYPNWESNRIPQGNQTADNVTVSIFRIDVDECDRLWVLDNGMSDINGAGRQIHPPTLVIFDLKTDKVIRRFQLKPDQYTDQSTFPNTIVDVTAGKCDEAFAYLPDLGDYDVIVYSFADNDSWKVKHNFFFLEPLEGDFNIAGLNFQWSDGVFAFSLAPPENDGFRTAYFHSLVSTHEFSVNTRILRNKTLATNPEYHLFKIEGKKGPKSHGTSSAFDTKKRILFQAQISKDGLGCWNIDKPLKEENFAIIAQDHVLNVFPNDIKMDAKRNLWIISDKMPLFMADKLNSTEVNYRILRIPVDEAIKGTVCEP